MGSIPSQEKRIYIKKLTGAAQRSCVISIITIWALCSALSTVVVEGVPTRLRENTTVGASEIRVAHTSSLFTSLLKTCYTALVTTDTHDGEPVVTFTVFINNTYFQLPRAVIFQIETNTNASFTFEDGEESDLLTFDPNFDLATYPVLEILKQIVYGGTQPAQAGEYGGELTVIVVNQEGTEVRLQTAVLQITITTGKI